MKRERADIKKIIKKRIELRHKNVVFLNKRNDSMNDNFKLRAFNKIMPVKLVNLAVDEYQPTLIQKKPVSIIITAFHAADFIEDCLNSIENQTYFKENNDYEILIGIDGCQTTLNKVISIYNKYRNLSVYLMPKNRGTYITTNTLLNLIKYNNIIRFDSDDIMMPELVNEVMYYSDEYDIIQLRYKNFKINIDNTCGNPDYANGAIFIKKHVFDVFGGYEPWQCAADYEFLMRVNKHVKIKKLNNLVLYRRMHKDSLTKKNSTKMNSSLRKKYHNYIHNMNYDNIISIKKKTNTYFKII
jgi:glycosyltransferase involved in cell wall biosynthesis